ncbi:hypothetical protein AB1Y20_015309 [Prymnesium parvum]|uniref:Uncharacterized protein n=1 Tax=Prymnesium parvum TaxID=97485 RepID=A0AB34JWD7_PRYPA
MAAEQIPFASTLNHTSPPVHAVLNHTPAYSYTAGHANAQHSGVQASLAPREANRSSLLKRSNSSAGHPTGLGDPGRDAPSSELASVLLSTSLPPPPSPPPPLAPSPPPPVVSLLRRSISSNSSLPAVTAAFTAAVDAIIKCDTAAFTPSLESFAAKPIDAFRSVHIAAVAPDHVATVAPGLVATDTPGHLSICFPSLTSNASSRVLIFGSARYEHHRACTEQVIRRAHVFVVSTRGFKFALPTPITYVKRGVIAFPSDLGKATSLAAEFAVAIIAYQTPAAFQFATSTLSRIATCLLRLSASTSAFIFHARFSSILSAHSIASQLDFSFNSAISSSHSAAPVYPDSAIPAYFTATPTYHISTVPTYHASTIAPSFAATITPYFAAIPTYHVSTVPTYHATTIASYFASTITPFPATIPTDYVCTVPTRHASTTAQFASPIPTSFAATDADCLPSHECFSRASTHLGSSFKARISTTTTTTTCLASLCFFISNINCLTSVIAAHLGIAFTDCLSAVTHRTFALELN